MLPRSPLTIAAVVVLSIGPGPARAGGPDEASPAKSVVKIFSSQRRPDLSRPWRKLDAQELSGSGVVIDGQRILTNAHVVTHASRIRVQPDQSGDQIAATVEAIATDIDLAVLKLADPGFFDKHPPLPRAAGLPKVRDAVQVAGYPEGGEALSLTSGIVSRIEYADYYFGRCGVRVQIDAAVNPGNSGGPVVVDGKMIGVVFSSLDQAENIGYIIPTEEIELFLEDVKDGSYAGKPSLYDLFQTVQNDALRANLGLPKGTNGMIVLHPDRDEASYPLKFRDVVTAIGDRAIDNAGKVEVEPGLRLRFDYLVQKLARNGAVRLSIVREGRPMNVDVPVSTLADHPALVPYLYESFPSYLVWGPLVFTAATGEYLHQFEDSRVAGEWFPHLARSQSPLLSRLVDRPAFEGEQPVILTTALPHRLIQGYASPSTLVVSEVDGVKIRNIRHLAECLRDARGDQVQIRARDRGTELFVFDRREALDAAEEIHSEYGIRKPYSDDLKSVFDGKK